MSSSPSDWLKLEAECLIRSRSRERLLDWSIEILRHSKQAPEAHHRLLLEELEAVAYGHLDHLMVLMPPGSAKSTYTSILFPAWWFSRHPKSSIIAASHTQSLADYFSRQVRRLVSTYQIQLGYTLTSDERTSSHWRISTGGEYYATSVRGAITGRRADLAIIDDPIKSRMEPKALLFEKSFGPGIGPT